MYTYITVTIYIRTLTLTLTHNYVTEHLNSKVKCL